MVATALKEYEVVTGVKRNHEKSVGLQLGTVRGMSMSSDSFVGRWTEEVWFDPNLLVDKNLREATSRVANLA